MKIIVALKRVPEFAEVDLKIDETGKDIRKDNLPFTINEADNYALEEALLLKEKYGGEITVLTVGEKSADEVLRLAMAKGAEFAVRIEGDYRDPVILGFLLSRAISEFSFDLILCGSFASDDGYAALGPSLASFLKLPFACYVNRINFSPPLLVIERELEGGKIEEKTLPLPCLLTISTGINTPRYASLLGIKRSQAREIKVLTLNSLGTNEKEIEEMSSLSLAYLSKPIREAKALFITGSADEISEKVAKLIKERGLL